MNKTTFYISLTQENSVPSAYIKLISQIDNSVFFNDTKKDEPGDSLNAHSISLFPDYLEPHFRNHKKLCIKKIPQLKITGYAIKIDSPGDIKTFLQSNYKKKFRNNINRFLNRFETCFTPTYKMFYGKISQKEYDFHMSELKTMLEKRFNQKNTKTHVLLDWEYYLEDTFPLINSKEASMFVIYVNQKPVHICINFHRKDVMFISVPSYDIDFEKFALGNISIYKLLEWSLAQSCKLLDMAYGDLEYKRRWSNYFYGFEQHILYPKGNILKKIIALREVLLINLKNKLKEINADGIRKKIKNNLNKKAKNNSFSYSLAEIENINLSNFKKINFIENASNEFGLRKIVFDFLYSHRLNMNEIAVYKPTEKNTFYLNSKGSLYKILIRNGKTK
ncbi:GNAT family N-acetyltransferase [Seonamhaeicola sp. MEBiC1930]|uniref:GNAT family N-acetyltransferase n=1 Tax=Seonamhaeicola sp. MEBiC01930 TaxID=2976768 RepID=UPI00324B034B